MTGYDWSTATAYALLFIFIYHLRSIFSYGYRNPQRMPPFSPVPPPPPVSVSELVSDEDLKLLIQILDSPSPSPLEKWENVIHRNTALLSYSASCSKPKEGPLKYLSTTVFENYSPERLRDFYMDNSYGKQWDKTVTDHVQLQLDTSYGTEVGRTMKKFPLLMAREYVLAWRLWEGSDSAFYCFTKNCVHLDDVLDGRSKLIRLLMLPRLRGIQLPFTGLQDCSSIPRWRAVIIPNRRSREYS